ncbi:SMI1 / KNR4 family (SUKH-1) [Pelosinus propionicus DSM 13327]|uniref:SMI1 / KNR4 family (SUKH-1) n=2 Tax=Pelosinus TaxID=365348 RepID=A0A1I4QAD6_9FIRM|nr:SMI1 / KNR4 family (SUKH-1) [Pelosinus propionicus DSM 13327]
MKKEYFKEFKNSSFWDDSDYAIKEYVSTPPTDDLIASVEQDLGYKLPASYIEMMKLHNGGIPLNTCFPTNEPTSWAEDHIAITGIMGIGREKAYSICGQLGSLFMIDEWGYPDFGVVICDCPSAGHDVVMLDYRKCGRNGEPEVIHVDQECDYEVTFLAKDFETFIRGLVNEKVYDTSEKDKETALEKVARGEFSPLLAKLCAHATEVENLEDKIREICTKIVEKKGFFALHADELSILMYDLQFWLYTKFQPSIDRERYLKDYEMILVFSGEFSTGGYAPSFITDWLNDRVGKGMIIETSETIRFTETAKEQLLNRLNETNNGEKLYNIAYLLVE